MSKISFYICSAFIFASIFANISAKISITYDESKKPEALIDPWRYEIMQADYIRELQELQTASNRLNDQVLLTNEKLGSTVNAFKTTIADIKNHVNAKDVTETIASCSEAALPQGSESAVYNVKLRNANANSFPVLCLRGPYGGSPWTIIQRRQDGSVDFFRKWNDYVNGFGTLYGEFWLGLEKIHQLTTSANHELWIRFDDFDGGSHYARYDSFQVGGKDTLYETLKIGSFYGDVTDSFSSHVNQKFTTKDADNDKDKVGNCAVQYTGAWWYRSCYNSNLNGRYLRNINETESIKNEKGIVWFTFSATHSLKYVHMAIRPRK